MNKQTTIALTLAVGLLTPSAAEASASDVQNMVELALSRMKVNEQITPETTGLFGERVDLNTGSISFQTVDVSLIGNSNLPVEIRRSYRGSRNNRGNNSSFGDWALDIPSITTTTLEYRPGRLSHRPKCAGELSPSFVNTGFATVGPVQYWSGDSLDIPGVANQRLLQGQRGTSGRYADNWKVSCIAGNVHGFIARSPEGITYTFDVETLIPASLIAVAQETSVLNPDYDYVELLRTYTLNVQVSRIEDRFGNWVNYNYAPSSVPAGTSNDLLGYFNKLTSIESSDGRLITIQYEPGASTERVRSVQTDDRTWTYTYREEYDARERFYKDVLEAVTRPDGKAWEFNLAFDLFGGFTSGSGGMGDCRAPADFSVTSTVRHPEGALFRLTQKPTRFGRVGVPLHHMEDFHPVDRCFVNMAITKKELEFNQEVLAWNYSYSQNAGSPKQTQQTTPPPEALTGLPASVTQGLTLMNLRSTSVNAPDGSRTVHVFDRRFNELEGQEILTLHYDINGSTLLQSKHFTFLTQSKPGSARLVSCKPDQYPVIGVETEECHHRFENQAQHEYHIYRGEVTTRVHSGSTQTSFSAQYSNYNAYGQPRLIREQGPEGEKFTRQGYQHDTDLWVLNQPTTTEVSSTNGNWTLASETKYYPPSHAYSLQPHQSWRFGELQSTNSSYHADGNVRRQTFNAANRYIEFNQYVRGIPTQIIVPDRYNASNTQTAQQVVNQRGEVTAITNFNGHTTQYAYDVMGRPTSIIPPSPWTPTTISYANASSRFVQTMTRGSYEKRIELDALFRPLLVRERDVSTGLRTFTNQKFNAYNNPVFTSLPSRSATESRGVETQYDGLQRVTRQASTVDGERTDYTYLAGNRVRQRNARGHDTYTTFRALGAPQHDLPTKIEQPEGVTTELTYNVFGNVTAITQGGMTESRLYDAQQRLCRQVRPDVGHTAYGYNAIGEMVWEAKGASGSASSCATSSVLAAEKVSYHYDNLGSLRQINYPDSSGNAQYTFDAQGQLTKLKSGNNEWTYSYNNLGLLEQEALQLDNLSFIFQSLYNDAGHLTARLYPSGRAVSFSPNGFGQPTRVGSYATGAEYAASGQLLSFNYGNGLSFSQTLDAKFRPATRSVGSGTTLFAHTYSYDLNSNLLSLTDSLIPVNSITLSYDRLDRLTSADGAWGSGSFSYDALGNITNKTLGSEHINYHYNSAKRLTSVSGALARSFNYDSRGNVTSNGARTFTYNRANRLTGSGGITYQYDGHGRRVSKTQGGTKTYSLYNQQGTLLATYKNGNYVEYYHLGQQLVARYNDAPQQGDGLGYTGHLEDDDLELTYMQQRYYDPLIGRFYSNDPVGTLGHLSQGNTQGFNRYAYANNNPYKYVDPDGRLPIAPAIVAGGRACASNAACRGAVVSGGRATARGARRAYSAIVGVFNESADATGQDAVDVVTGGKEATRSGKKSGITTDFMPDISSGEADGIMDEVKGLDGVTVKETENERGPMTVVTTSDGTKVIDRVGGGGVRSIETQSGDSKTKTRVRDEQK